jgi:hypothetical protein
MLVGVSFGRVNREMVFRPFFAGLPIKQEEKALPAGPDRESQALRKLP